MAYIGKFVDRSPKIHPAGVCKYEKEESIQRTLNDLNTDYSEYSVKKPALKSYPLRPVVGDIYAGYETQMKNALQPENNKNIFQSLLDEFKETRYKSYWNKRLGRCRDYTPGLPHSIDPDTYCFGAKVPRGIPAGDLINPKKSEHEVILESEVGHKLYVKTHNDYYAGEQINREYNNPPINKALVWGIRYPHSKEGRCAKYVMHIDSTKRISERQKHFEEQNYPKLGKPHAPNNNIKNVSRGHRFGITTSDPKSITVADTMQDCESSDEKQAMLKALEIINSLRTNISKRTPAFEFPDFLATFQYKAESYSGYVDFETAYEILLLFNINISKETFDTICTSMEIKSIDDATLINYKELLHVLCPNLPFPKLKKNTEVSDALVFESEYQEKYNRKDEGKKSDCFSDNIISGRTDFHMLLSPSIYTQYGVCYDDFFKVLTKTQMARLFKNIEIEIPEDKFEIIWELASKQNEHGKVCLHSFTNVLKETMPDLKITF